MMIMETKIKSKRGGVRAGAGRPKGSNSKVKKIQIRLTEKEIAILKIASYPKSLSRYIREKLGLDSDITNKTSRGK